MIEINKLRRLAQEATPGPWYIGSGTYEGLNIYSVEAVTDDEGFTYNPVVATAEDDDAVCWDTNARLIAAANPAVISELLDRLEAAEADALEQARLNGMGSEREAALLSKLEAAEKERGALRIELNEIRYDAAHQKALAESALRVAEGWEEKCNSLRAKIEAMEKQESVATVIKEGDSRYWMSERLWTFPDGKYSLYALPGAQQCKNCNGMGDRFDPSGEKIPCDLCESHLEEIRSLVAEAAHDIISGSDFWLSISLAAKKIYALPGTQTQGEENEQ